VLRAVRTSYPFVVATAASVVFSWVTAGCRATPPAATPASPVIQLQPYTTPDQSASAGVPSGWQVTLGQQTTIQMTGPKGEIVSLGAGVVARNAAFQLGQRAANGIDLSMPYAATLPQKLAMILQQGTANSGKPFSQFTVTSETPLQLPATLGHCARLVAGFSGQQGLMKIMGVFCSLPLDSGGTYKNIWLLAQAPAAVAAQSAPTAQAIFASYSVPPAWLQRKLAPNTAPRVLGGVAPLRGGSIVPSTAGIDISVNCFDLSVLRNTPTYDLPQSCGGTKPD
jgi:hypothetical protein